MALSEPQVTTVRYVSAATGLDPRVVITWLLSGGAPWNPYQATARARQLGLQNYRGQTAGQELVGISRVSGLSLQGLFTNFFRLFGTGAEGSYMGPQTAYAVASTVQTGSASDATSFTLTDVPGAVGGAASAATGAIGGAVSALTGWVTQLTKWIEGWALRVSEIVGGFLLVLIGLYLLARQVGLASDAPAGGPLVAEAVS